MKATKLTKAPEGFAYYRVCDPEGICRIIRGAFAAQRLVEDMPRLSTTKTTLYRVDWSSCSYKTCTTAELNKSAITNPMKVSFPKQDELYGLTTVLLASLSRH